MLRPTTGPLSQISQRFAMTSSEQHRPWPRRGPQWAGQPPDSTTARGPGSVRRQDEARWSLWSHRLAGVWFAGARTQHARHQLQIGAIAAWQDASDIRGPALD